MKQSIQPSTVFAYGYDHMPPAGLDTPETF